MPTINLKFIKKKVKGKKIDVQFPRPYYKVCGKYAKLFNLEVTICIWKNAPFHVASWKDIFYDNKKIMWSFSKYGTSYSYFLYFSFFS